MDQKDILNALHHCFNGECFGCPYDGTIEKDSIIGCSYILKRDAANEISRLQAELIELKEDIEDELSMRKCKF